MPPGDCHADRQPCRGPTSRNHRLAADLHAHPELLFDVHRTAGSVAEKLKAFGCDEVVTGLGRTGVVGVIRGRKGSAGRNRIARRHGCAADRGDE